MPTMPTVPVFALRRPCGLCERTLREAHRNTDLCLTGVETAHTHTHTAALLWSQHNVALSNSSHWLGLQKACPEKSMPLCASAVVCIMSMMETFLMSDDIQELKWGRTISPI